ncbi:hypothetical protein [Marilutibacter spongiae]|uniref:Peptidase M61 catalytic domain-containing protein n=1 Tax=Marilutibacter spongiae TaxID=2025720 RepID=A0A7W3TKA1_9GAMM|nr:hypothetical protein [Lysobacter spongiae]MBB1059876.1 hypothetical protein [Lysobacter spongiae]
MNRPRPRAWVCGGPCLWALLACTGPARAGDAPPVEREPALDMPGGELRIELPEAAPARRRMLQAWVDEVAAGIPATFGRWPLQRAWVRIVEIDSRDRSPVPWGQTKRGGASPGVLLYVRRDAGLAELRADWTATHEFAHLFHPYLGREGRWLAEGLASYYQNVVRARAGTMAPREAWRALDAGFRRGERETVDGPLASAGRGETMRVYWAGAAFWLEADLALRRRGQHLDQVLADHAACCLATAPPRDPAAFVAALDRVAGTSVLAPLYRRHAAARSFPALAGSYATLGLRREGDALRFDAAGREARTAIMGSDAAR